MAGSFRRPTLGGLRIGGGALVTILAAALVLFVGAWQIARSRDMALADAGNQARTLASALAEHAARTIDGVDLLLTGVIDQIETSADRSNLKALLTRRAAALSQIHKLAVVAADGSWAYDSVGPHTPLNSADRAYFRWHRDHADPDVHIDLPFASHYDGRTVIPVSRRLNRPDGTFDGVVSATLNRESFRQFYDRLRLGEQGAIALWLDTGRILVREPEAPAMMGRDLSSNRLFTRELRAAPSGVYRLDASSVDGLERIVAFERVGRYPLVVTAAIAVEDVLAPWRREALIQGFVMVVATTALLGLGLGLMRRDRRVAESERASRDAQSLFRAVFETSTDSQFVHRIEADGGFRLEACNAAGAQAMGLSPGDAVGRRLEALMAPALVKRARADLDLVIAAEEPVRRETEIEFGGSAKTVEVIQAPLRDPETGIIDRVFVGMRDITHLKAAEAEAREANRLLVLAEQTAHLGHWHVALPSQRLTWSNEIFRIHGLDPATFTPTIERGIAAYHPDDRARVAECVARALDRQEAFEFELRIIRPDGEIRHVHCRGSCQAEIRRDGIGEDCAVREGQSIFGVFADVTEARLAVARLSESEARYRLLADNTSDIIALSDAADRQTYISPAVTTMLGRGVDETRAIGLRSLVHPEDRAAVAATIGGLSPGRPTASVIHRLRHEAGHMIWVEAAFRRIEGEGGAHVIEAVRDVTLRQEQSADLERAKIAAEAGATVKAEFLANMSHELRTPLTGMLGVHDLLQGDYTLTEPQRRLIRIAQESGRSLLTIVNDILDFSKIEAGHLSIDAAPFDLAALVESCRALSAEAAEGRGLSIVVEIDPSAPEWLVGDAARLRQVLLNLSTNAVKFTRAGRVTLRALWRDGGDGAGSLRIEVADTGIGIAADTLPRLFERFSQADGSISRQYGGTGLGLAICRRLVQLMGGEIGVESALGQGSTFWLTLPMSRGRRRSATTETAQAELGPTRARRILLAEDNPINQEVIAAVLRQKGHAVTVVGDGLAAIAAVHAGTMFDIVLMDIQMPGKDGLSATEAIREWERTTRRARVPVVALTANAMSEEVARCRAAGMDAHVAKPVDWPALVAVMERLTEPTAILDEATLETLAAAIGEHRVPGLLTAFRAEIERRMARLSAPALTAADLASEAHALASMAGQLGFLELSRICRELDEAAAGRDEGLARLAELRDAAARALAAASRSPYASAA